MATNLANALQYNDIEIKIIRSNLYFVLEQQCLTILYIKTIGNINS